MEYSIGEVAEKLGLTTHTLRYYDKERLLPRVRKNSAGLRRFSDEDVNRLYILECLKATGLQLKEIKHYFDLCEKGDSSLSERLAIFQKQKERLEKQIQDLNQNIARIKFKIEYYQEALQGGEKGIFERNKKLAKEKEELFKK